MSRQGRLVAAQLRAYKGRLNARLLQDEYVSQDLTSLIYDMRQIPMLDSEAIVSEAESLAQSEAKFTAEMLTAGTTAIFAAPTAAAMTKALSAAVPVEGGMSVPEMLSVFQTKKSAAVLQVIMDGSIAGSSTSAIVKEVGSFINSLVTRQAQSLVNTILSAVSSAGRLATYQQNADLVDQYQWVSTLDGLTSLICMGRDGNVYQIGEGPMPPAHFNCRSTTIPKVRSEYNLNVPGMRPAIGADGVEQISSSVRYSGWLRQQPKSFIDEALGTARSKLFREGVVTLDRFTDPTGKKYTLAQLDSMNFMALSPN